MKKILGLTVAALLVMGLVGGGTWAYFSDTETATANTLTAGTLTLTTEIVGEGVISVSNTYPSDNASAVDWVLDNDGTIDGWLEITTSALTPTDGAADGTHLEDDLFLLFWLDENTNGQLDDGEKYLSGSDTISTYSGSTIDPAAAKGDEDLYALATLVSSLAGQTWGEFGVDPSPVMVIANGDDTQRFIGYYFFRDDGSAQNDAQGDAVAFDITFNLYQNP